MTQPLSKNFESIPATPYCKEHAVPAGFNWGGTFLAQRRHQNVRPRQDYTVSSITNSYEGLMPSRSFTTSGTNFWSSFNTEPASLITRNLNSNNSPMTGFYCFNKTGGGETELKQKVCNADGATSTSHLKGGPCNRESRNDMQGLGKISKLIDCTPEMKKTGSVPLRKPARGMRCNSTKDKSKSGCAPPKKQRNRKPPVLTRDCPSKKSADNAGEFDVDHEDLVVAANSVNNTRERACSDLFWKKMESLFAPVAVQDIPILKRKRNDELNQTGPLVFSDVCESVGVATECSSMRGTDNLDQGSVISTDYGGLKAIKPSNVDTSLFQRLLSAFIDEDGGRNSYVSGTGNSLCINDDSHKAGVVSEVQSEAKLHRQKYFLLDGLSETCSASASASTSVQKDPSSTFCYDELCQVDDNLSGCGLTASNSEVLFGNDQDDQNAIRSTEVDRRNCEYQALSLDEKLSLELRSIGLNCGEMPLGDSRQVQIDGEIKGLQMELHQQTSKVNNSLKRVEKALKYEQELERRTSEEYAMDHLVQMAYKRIKVRRPGKASKEEALAFANRTLARCKQFEDSGRSCFSAPYLRDIIFKRAPIKIDVEPADGLKRKRDALKNTKLKDLGPVSGAIQKRASGGSKLRNGSTRFQQTLIQSPKPHSGLINEKEQFPHQISGCGLKVEEATTITQPGQVPCGRSASYDPIPKKGKMKLLHDIINPAFSKVNCKLGEIHIEGITKNRDKKEVAEAFTSRNVCKPEAAPKQQGTISRIGMQEVAKSSQLSTVKPGNCPIENNKESEVLVIPSQPSSGSDHLDKILVELANFRAPYLPEDLRRLLDHKDLFEVDSEGLDVPLDNLSDINLFL